MTNALPFFSTSGRTIDSASRTSVGDVEVFQIHRHLAGFDLRQIEDVADQLQQVFAGGVDLAEVGQEVVLADVFAFLLQQFRVTDDRVQRRAQLM